MSKEFPKGGKNALVTGAAGFLGSHLTDRLLAEGWNVTGLDNLQTGSLDNIAHLNGNAQFRFVKQDVIEPLEIDARVIFNLACPASPPAYQADPIHTYKTSVLGMLNVLELADRQKAIVVQASTSEVYGDPEVHPQKEEYWGHVNPIGIRSCYDEGKRGAETLCFDFRRQRNVDVKVARIFNTYGPRMDPNDGRVVSNFIVQALKGESLTIYGEGKQTRSFCYCDDLVAAIHGLSKLPPGEGGPVNIGNPGEFNMIELAEKVLKLTGSKSKLVYRDLPSDDPKQRKPDISRAKALMGWEPKVPLQDGLEKTIAYFKTKLGV